MKHQTFMIKNFLRITKIVQVSAMKVHFQIAERSLFYLNPDIHYRRMTYPPEQGMTYPPERVNPITTMIMKIIPIIIVFLTSCHPPRIIYSQEDTSVNTDSLSIRLIRGSMYGGIDLHLRVFLSIKNNVGDSLILQNSSTAKIVTDEGEIELFMNGETKDSTLLSSEDSNVSILFQGIDESYLAYNHIYKDKHHVELTIRLKAKNGRLINKRILLRIARIKRHRYEKNYDLAEPRSSGYVIPMSVMADMLS